MQTLKALGNTRKANIFTIFVVDIASSNNYLQWESKVLERQLEVVKINNAAANICCYNRFSKLINTHTVNILIMDCEVVNSITVILRTCQGYTNTILSLLATAVLMQPNNSSWPARLQTHTAGSYSCPFGTGRLDQVTSRGTFQHQPFYDSVKTMTCIFTTYEVLLQLAFHFCNCKRMLHSNMCYSLKLEIFLSSNQVFYSALQFAFFTLTLFSP